MSNIELFYGYTNDLIIGIENNGFSIAEVTDINFIFPDILITNKIFYELKTRLPIKILSNSSYNFIVSLYSLQYNSISINNDITCKINFYETQDSSIVIDTTVINIDTTIINYDFRESNEIRKNFNLYYIVNSSNNDKTYQGIDFFENEYFLIKKFEDKLLYNYFNNTYQPLLCYLETKSNKRYFSNNFIYQNNELKLGCIFNSSTEIINEKISKFVLFYKKKY